MYRPITRRRTRVAWGALLLSVTQTGLSDAAFISLVPPGTPSRRPT